MSAARWPRAPELWVQDAPQGANVSRPSSKEMPVSSTDDAPVVQGIADRHREPAPAPPRGTVPVLLCNAAYYGTLAAVRALGSRGVPVVTADASRLAAGRWSKHTTKHLRCPPSDDTDAFVDWLLKFGRIGPRHAIYATSDAVSFALSRYRNEIAECFEIYQPDIGTTMSILDKGRLEEHARAVGIDTPQTWLPQSRREVEQIAAGIDGTIIVKPRSQLAVRTHSKGAIGGNRAADIVAQYDALVEQGDHRGEFARHYPECMQPMLQRYHAEAMTGIYSLSGFRDASGYHVAILGSLKILQRPRRLGIGLCFEEADVDPGLAERTLRLCERIGYYGAFELEFIRCGGRDLLIDFNGRFYNQMVFDMARGLDLAGLAYAGATGDAPRIADLVARARSGRKEALAFCNGFGVEFTIGAQRLFGTMTREEAAQWRGWRTAPGRNVVDAVRDPADPLPATIDATLQMLSCLRHPRAFWRQFGMDARRAQ